MVWGEGKISFYNWLVSPPTFTLTCTNAQWSVVTSISPATQVSSAAKLKRPILQRVSGSQDPGRKRCRGSEKLVQTITPWWPAFFSILNLSFYIPEQNCPCSLWFINHPWSMTLINRWSRHLFSDIHMHSFNHFDSLERGPVELQWNPWVKVWNVVFSDIKRTNRETQT